jgi:hypothetical protein
LEAGSVPLSLNFPQLDFVEPSSGFHPVTWERVNKLVVVALLATKNRSEKKGDNTLVPLPFFFGTKMKKGDVIFFFSSIRKDKKTQIK